MVGWEVDKPGRGGDISVLYLLDVLVFGLVESKRMVA